MQLCALMHTCVHTQVREGVCKCSCTCSSALLAEAEGGGADGAEPQAVGSLLPGSVAGLVWVPQLLAVVAELRPAALPAARDLGTAGAAEGDDRVPAQGQGTEALKTAYTRRDPSFSRTMSDLDRPIHYITPSSTHSRYRDSVGRKRFTQR